MSNDWSFTPSKSDIFKKDLEGNYIYHKWSWGSGYIVNDEKKQNQLLNLEGYRGFICSYRAPIILPIVILAFIIGGVITIFTQSNIEIKQLIVLISFILYILSCFIYLGKINKVLKGCVKK